MKKILYFAAALTVSALAACSDQNEVVKDIYDEVENRPVVKQTVYTLTTADYTAISTAATAAATTEEEKALAAAVKSSNTLNSFASADKYVPAQLSGAFPALRQGSSVQVTYDFSNDIPAYLSDLTGAPTYSLSPADYKGIWGEESATAFLTPANSPADVLPGILKAAYPDAGEGDVVVANYKYANQEPVVVPGDGDEESELPVVGVPFFEDFEGYNGAATPYEHWNLNGWTEIITKGDGSKYWQIRTYSGNKYGQVTANGGVDEVTEAYTLSPIIDLSMTRGNVFSFSVCVGYYNYNGLKVLITEDEKALTDPAAVTWDDVTSNFTIPQEPATGYGVISPAGEMNLDAKYAGKKIIIAFKYYGEKGTGNTYTTTYQIDNVLIAADTLLAEDFEVYNGAATPYEHWNLNGWTEIITKGDGSKYWQIRTYSGNKYGQVTANGGVDETTEIYVVSHPVNLSATTDNVFSFSVCVGYYNYNGLKVLVTEDEKALTDPAAVTWDDVTSNFTIPQEPATGYGVISPAGEMNLDAKYAGKTIYIAFKYYGEKGTGNTYTTTYQIDDVLVEGELSTTLVAKVFAARALTPRAAAMTRAAAPAIATVTENTFYTFDGTNWAPMENAIMVNPADYAAMGVESLTATTAPDYLPAFFAQKFPYAQQGDRKAARYGAAADEYALEGGVWASTKNAVTQTEQFVYAENGWMFDPTVNYIIGKDDYQIIVSAVLSDPATNMFTRGTYTNEEWYYGTSAYYGNFNFRLSGSETSSRDVESSKKFDTELHGLKTDAEKVDLLWKRMTEDAMMIFLKAKYPMATAEIQGAEVLYKMVVLVYNPDGVTATSVYYRLTYKVVTPGSAGNPPTFEFVEKEEIGTSL